MRGRSCCKRAVYPSECNSVPVVKKESAVIVEENNKDQRLQNNKYKKYLLAI